MTPDELAARAEHWARALTAIPSVTGSAAEAAFADRLVEMLRHSPAFGGPSAVIETLAVPGGSFPRQVVLALRRGRGRRTVVLTGHYDVVSIDNFGEMLPLAFDPDALLPALIATLAAEPESAANLLALADLRSGNFLPGRGLLDMKAGLGAAIAAIEAFAADPEAEGNLLFVAVPDEEANSAGARAAATHLRDFAARHRLDLEAAINMDAIADDGDGSKGRVVTLGTIGKLLPTALVVGVPIHASYSHRGFSAAALAGALAAEMEWAPEFVERLGEEVSAAPTLLGSKDTRLGYDVTTPERAWMYWNVALLQHTAQRVLDLTRAVAERAAITFCASLEARRKAAGLPGTTAAVRVLTYAELLGQVEALRPGTAAEIDGEAMRLSAEGQTLPEIARASTELLWSVSGWAGPAIVLGFGSTPYAPVLLGDTAGAQRLDRATRAAVGELQAAGLTLGIRPFFPAISDVSFFGEADAAAFAPVAANTPMWRTALGMDEKPPTANLPTINAGPWGRDYHGRTERLAKDYAFAVLPRLLLAIARQVLSA